jgi:quercetin dioxygenase-like cupin family protein
LPDIGLSPETKTVNRDLIVVDANAMVWEERFNEKIGRALYRKNLIEDPDTGMEIRLVRYPAGVINPLHTHPCAHGMFVLEGTLVTHDGTYGQAISSGFRKERSWSTALVQRVT